MEQILSLLIDKGILIALLFWLFIAERKRAEKAEQRADECQDQRAQEAIELASK